MLGFCLAHPKSTYSSLETALTQEKLSHGTVTVPLPPLVAASPPG